VRRKPSSQSRFDTMVRTAHPTALTHPKQIQKQFTTEAQRKAFGIVNCACGAVKKVKLCASVVKFFLVSDCRPLSKLFTIQYFL
jgi:hypothetical protein